MSVAAYRVRHHANRAKLITESDGDTDQIVTLLVPRPRNIPVTLNVGGFEFDAEETVWDYKQEQHLRARPPQEEIERAIAEGRFQGGKPSFYSHFYNDNQIDGGKIRTTSFYAAVDIDHDAPMSEEEAGGRTNATIYREPTPGAFRKLQLDQRRRNSTSLRKPAHPAK